MDGVARSNDGVVIKRCAFCGGEARIEAESIGKEKYLYSVSCINDCVTQGIYHKTVDSAIKAWNNRKPLERVIEMLEERRKTNADFWDRYDDEMSFGKMSAFYEAIEIIKQELM